MSTIEDLEEEIERLEEEYEDAEKQHEDALKGSLLEENSDYKALLDSVMNRINAEIKHKEDLVKKKVEADHTDKDKELDGEIEKINNNQNKDGRLKELKEFIENNKKIIDDNNKLSRFKHKYSISKKINILLYTYLHDEIEKIKKDNNKNIDDKLKELKEFRDKYEDDIDFIDDLSGKYPKEYENHNIIIPIKDTLIDFLSSKLDNIKSKKSNNKLKQLQELKNTEKENIEYIKNYIGNHQIYTFEDQVKNVLLRFWVNDIKTNEEIKRNYDAFEDFIEKDYKNELEEIMSREEIHSNADYIIIEQNIKDTLLEIYESEFKSVDIKSVDIKSDDFKKWKSKSADSKSDDLKKWKDNLKNWKDNCYKRQLTVIKGNDEKIIKINKENTDEGSKKIESLYDNKLLEILLQEIADIEYYISTSGYGYFSSKKKEEMKIDSFKKWIENHTDIKNFKNHENSKYIRKIEETIIEKATEFFENEITVIKELDDLKEIYNNLESIYKIQGKKIIETKQLERLEEKLIEIKIKKWKEDNKEDFDDVTKQTIYLTGKLEEYNKNKKDYIQKLKNYKESEEKAKKVKDKEKAEDIMKKFRINKNRAWRKIQNVEEKVNELKIDSEKIKKLLKEEKCSKKEYPFISKTCSELMEEELLAEINDLLKKYPLDKIIQRINKIEQNKLKEENEQIKTLAESKNSLNVEIFANNSSYAKKWLTKINENIDKQKNINILKLRLADINKEQFKKVYDKKGRWKKKCENHKTPEKIEVCNLMIQVEEKLKKKINDLEKIGGKKKKILVKKIVRKHRGIIQTGGNKGRLRKGYKYTGKKLKNGLPQITKCKINKL